MFTTLMKDVDGRRTYRHFRQWDNAEHAMQRDVAAVKKLVSVSMEQTIDKFNVEKGVYERGEVIVTTQGMKFLYLLLDTYFEGE